MPDNPSPAGPPATARPINRPLWREPFYWLLAALPLALFLELLDAGSLWVFLASALALVPLAGLLGRATEGLAESLGPGIGGLLNATFGNAAELIIAFMALRQGPALYPLVKASITGSIVGNILLVLGAAMLLGGLVHRRQVFNATAAGMGAALLALASIGLLVPALFSFVVRADPHLRGQARGNAALLSVEIAGVLAVIYLLSLIFSLRTHRHLFAGPEVKEQEVQEQARPEWRRGPALLVMLLATVGVAWMSELLVTTVNAAAEALHLGRIFVGVILVAIVGNAAEHSTAVMMALRNKMDLAFHIAVGSAIQVALFVAPVLVFASLLLTGRPDLDLHFTLLETAAVVLAVGVLALICLDGETHWMEGVMLLGVYVILALAFYHLPEAVR
jgi:Ca2+:H+ antiporter